MAKHKPPSRIKYERENPMVSFRLPRELKEELDKHRGDKSYSEFIKQLLTKELNLRRELERTKKDCQDYAQAMYEQGYDEGYADAKK